MARLFFTGFEQGQYSTVLGSTEHPNFISSSTLPIAETSLPRSGSRCMRCTNSAVYGEFRFTGALATDYYSRAYVMPSTVYPGTATRFMTFLNATGNIVSVRMGTDGSVSLWREQLAGSLNAMQVGSASSPLNFNQYYRIELRLRVAGTLGLDTIELRIDGTTIASDTLTNITDTAPTTARWGWTTAPSTGTIHVDDVALNDSTGTSSNSWPGEGKILMLHPTTDTVRDAGWLNGAGGTTTLWDGLDNEPPIGVSAGSDANRRIQNAINTTTQNYEATTETYTAAGVPAGATFTAVQTVAQIADGGNASAVSSARINHTANPASGVSDVTGSTSTTTAVGNSPTGWLTHRGPMQHAPSPTLGTGAQVRIGKNTGSTTALYCDYLALMVEYVDPVVVNHEVNPSDTVTLSDSLTSAERGVQAVADDLLVLDDLTASERVIQAVADDTLTVDDLRSTDVGKRLDDTLTLNDSLSAALGFQAAVNDTLTLADAQGFERGASISTGDTLTLADAIVSFGFMEALADNLGLTDAQAFSLMEALGDTLTLNDAATAMWGAVRDAGNDTLTLNDSATTESGKVAAAADTVTVTDGAPPESPSALGGYKLGVDLVPWDAGQTFTVEFEFRIPNTGTAGAPLLGQTNGAGTVLGENAGGYVPAVYFDTTGKLRVSAFWHGQTGPPDASLAHEWDDGQRHKIGITYSSGVQRVIIDGAERVTWTIGQTSYSSNYSYFVGAAKAASWTNVPTLDSNGWFYLTNGWVGNFVFTAGTAKTPAQIGMPSAGGMSLGVGKGLSESLPVTDDLSKVVVLTTADSLPVADAQRFDRGQSISDPLTVADSASPSQGWERTQNDSLVLADAQSLIQGWNRTVNDSTTVADALTTARAIAAALSDSATAADAASVVRGIQQALADSATATDAASVSQNKSINDVLVLSDSTSSLFQKILDDALSLSDDIIPVTNGAYVHMRPPLDALGKDYTTGGLLIAVVGDGTITVYDASGAIVTTDFAGNLIDGDLRTGEVTPAEAGGIVFDEDESGVGV